MTKLAKAARILWMAVIGTVVVLVPIPVSAGATPPQKCESGKNNSSGKYVACRHKAQAKFVKGGEIDTAKRDALLLKCEDKYGDAWPKHEFIAGGTCPSVGDEADVKAFLDACVLAVTDALGGAPLPVDVLSCQSQLAACQEQTGRPLKSGQTVCYNIAGLPTPCTGTGQDGQYQFGIARSFTDNGDGTISDNSTGLMWEKLSDNGDIHDKDTTYTWTLAFAKAAALNSGAFAGYNDWRVPNANELESLANYQAYNPTVYPAFHAACMAGCSVLTCSCASASSWSSTTWLNDPSLAHGFSHVLGGSGPSVKSSSSGVRAVRGGVF